jgi:PEGA domain
MKRTCWLLGLLACSLLTGCVERRFVIESVPPGAQVLRNGKPVGFTPCDDSFVYYGKYHFSLIKDGYETAQVIQAVPTPWWQIPPLDFITENVLPWKFRDIRRFNYQMQPLRAVNSNEVLQRATQMRVQGKQIGERPPTAAQTGPPIPGAPAVPAVPAAPGVASSGPR